MTNGKYFLSIDNGTQSVRAMVFDGEGQLIAKSKVEIEPYFSTQKGWAEQHAKLFLGLLMPGLPRSMAAVIYPQGSYCSCFGYHPACNSGTHGKG